MQEVPILNCFLIINHWFTVYHESFEIATYVKDWFIAFDDIIPLW